MRRYLALVCACVMLLCIAVSVWAADLDQRDDTVSGEDITWIGDSYSVIMEPLIIGLYPGVEIYAQGGRRFFVDQQGNIPGIRFYLLCQMTDGFVLMLYLRLEPAIIPCGTGPNWTRGLIMSLRWRQLLHLYS